MQFGSLKVYDYRLTDAMDGWMDGIQFKFQLMILKRMQKIKTERERDAILLLVNSIQILDHDFKGNSKFCTTLWISHYLLVSVLTELCNVLAVLMELVVRAQCLKEGHQLFFSQGGQQMQW